MKTINYFLVFVLCFAGLRPGFAAEEKKEAAAAPSAPASSSADIGNLTESKGMSERVSTDGLTYDAKMKNRKAREEYNAQLKQYEEMMEKQKKEAAGQTTKEEEEKALKEKETPAPKKIPKKRVLVSK